MKKNNWENKSIVFIMATIATALWGSAYPSVKIGYELFQVAHDDIGSKLVFAGYRFAIAGLLVLIMFKATYKRDPRKTRRISTDGIKRMLGAFLVLGLMQTTMQYVFFYIGLANTTGSKGSIINASGAFFGVLLAPLFYRDDKITRKKLLGCVVGFAGILILNFDGGSLGGFVIIGEGFVLMSALMNVFASFYSKSLVKRFDVFLTTGMQLLMGGTVLLIIGWLSGGHIVFTGKGFVLLIYMALISSVGFSLWTMLLKYNPASEVTIYNLFIPVFGNILSGVFLGENIFTVVNISAVVLVSMGIIFVNSRDRLSGTAIDDAVYDDLKRYIDESMAREDDYACMDAIEALEENFEVPEFLDGIDADSPDSMEEADLFAGFDEAAPTPAYAPAAKERRDTLFGVPSGNSKMSSAVPQFEMPMMQAFEDRRFQPQESFSEMLLRKIDEAGLTDAAVYKKANVDRRLFSKIRSNSGYKPSRATAIAFALALEMDEFDADELLMKAGYALSDSSVADLIIRFCIDRGIYNLMDVNELLSEYDQPLIGM